MTVSSQTIRVSNEDYYDEPLSANTRLRNRSISPQKSISSVKSYRSLRSTRSTASSVDSRHSADITLSARVESDRLKAFLNAGGSRAKSDSSSSTHSQDSLGENNSTLVESDRLKQFLGHVVPKSRSPSVSSCESLPAAAQESDRLKNFLQSDSGSSSSNSSDSKSGSVGLNHTIVDDGDRRRRFFTSERKSSNSIFSKTVPRNQNKKSENTKPLNGTGKSYGKLVESDRLKQFLQSDTDSKTAADIDSVSDSSSRSSSPIAASLARKCQESQRLKAFLQSDEGVGSGGSSPESTYVRLASKRDLLNGGRSNCRSGLTQVMDDVHLDIPGDEDTASPPKRRLVGDGFSFDSDEEDNRTAAVKAKASAPATKTQASAEPVKPVINFEKMEGKKTKTLSKPVRKLLGSPGKV